MKDLSEVQPKLYKKIVDSVEVGNQLEVEGSCKEALEVYLESLSMLPKPMEEWDIYHWVAKCICHVYINEKKYTDAQEWAHKAVESKPPKEAYSVILLGITLLGLGEDRLAYEEFKKAFEMGGKRAFQGFDKTYLSFFLNFKEK